MMPDSARLREFAKRITVDDEIVETLLAMADLLETHVLVPREFSKNAYYRLVPQIGYIGSSYPYFAKHYWPAILAAAESKEKP